MLYRAARLIAVFSRSVETNKSARCDVSHFINKSLLNAPKVRIYQLLPGAQTDRQTAICRSKLARAPAVALFNPPPGPSYNYQAMKIENVPIAISSVLQPFKDKTHHRPGIPTNYNLVFVVTHFIPGILIVFPIPRYFIIAFLL